MGNVLYGYFRSCSCDFRRRLDALARFEWNAHTLREHLPQSALWISQKVVADNTNNCLHNISGLSLPEALPLQLHEPFWDEKFERKFEILN